MQNNGHQRPPTSQGNQLLTIPEVAARLRCGRTSVYELIARGELAVVDIAVTRTRAKTRVTDKSVDEFIASRTRTTGPELAASRHLRNHRRGQS